MATVIDTLAIALELDTEGVKKGEAQTKKSMAVVQKNAKETGRELKNATTGMLKFFAVAFGAAGFSAMAQDIIKVNTALGNIAQRSGQSASSIKFFNQYVETLGESGDAAAATLYKISQYAQNVKFGIIDEGIALFNKLNVSLYDSNNNAKESIVLIHDVAAAMEKMNMTDADKSTALSLAGYDAGTIQAILRGSDALQKVIDEGKKNKETINDQTDAARRLTEQVNKLKNQINLLANDAMLQAEPYLISAFKWLSENGDTVESAIVGVATVLTIALIPALLATTTALLPALLAITAVAAAYSEYLKIKRGDKDALDPKKVKEGAGLYWDDAKKWMKGKLYPNRTEKTADDIAAEKFLKSGKSIGGNKPLNTDGLEQAKMDGLENKYDLPQGMLDSVWKQESNRGKYMLSPAGAKGHFQFMPKTAAEYGIAGKENDFNASSDAAARKLSHLMKLYNGDAEKALQAYNWGEGNMASGKVMPTETKNYSRQILGRMGVNGGGKAVLASASMPTMKGNTGSVGGGSSSEVNIGTMNINTQATNATAIAGSIEAALKTNTLISQANSGIN